MSHVDFIECEIDPDLIDLKAALARIDKRIEVVKQSTYKWFGRSVGDYPIPAGLTEKDLGKCEYAIKFPPDLTARGYEVGLIRHPDKPHCLTPVFDFWDGGLAKTLCGDKAPRLTQFYLIERAKRLARANGEVVEEVTQPNGTIELYCANKKESFRFGWKRMIDAVKRTAVKG